MVRSKGGMVAEVGTKEFQEQAYQATLTAPLSQSEIMELTEEKKELEITLSEIQSSPGSSKANAIDIGGLQGKIRRIEQTIENRTPDKAGAKTRDGLYREERELEEKLIIGMPTRYEMEHPQKCPGAVRKHMAWDSRNKLLIQRYVQIQRILRPEEPKSIEELRSEGGPRR